MGRNIESRVSSVNFEPLTPPPTSIIDGALDAAGKMLTLDTEGPSFTGYGSLVPYLDIIEIESDDYWALKSRAPDKERTWVEFMMAHYRHKT